MALLSTLSPRHGSTERGWLSCARSGRLLGAEGSTIFPT